MGTGNDRSGNAMEITFCFSSRVHNLILEKLKNVFDIMVMMITLKYCVDSLMFISFCSSWTKRQIVQIAT